jgi:hypothetical protein
MCISPIHCNLDCVCFFIGNLVECAGLFLSHSQSSCLCRIVASTRSYRATERNLTWRLRADDSSRPRPAFPSSRCAPGSIALRGVMSAGDFGCRLQLRPNQVGEMVSNGPKRFQPLLPSTRPSLLSVRDVDDCTLAHTLLRGENPREHDRRMCRRHSM